MASTIVVPSGAQIETYGPEIARQLIAVATAAKADIDGITGSDVTAAELASVATGAGASLIGIEDAGGLYTATKVETALAEVKTIANAALPTALLKSGTSTLVSGTVTISSATITANSRIVITMKDFGAGAITGLAALAVPVATRSVGAPGSFVVNAIDDSKALIATAACTFDWIVIG